MQPMQPMQPTQSRKMWRSKRNLLRSLAISINIEFNVLAPIPILIPLPIRTHEAAIHLKRRVQYLKNMIRVSIKLLACYQKTCEKLYQFGGDGFIVAMNNFHISSQLYEYLYNTPVQSRHLKRLKI